MKNLRTLTLCMLGLFFSSIAQVNAQQNHGYGINYSAMDNNGVENHDHSEVVYDPEKLNLKGSALKAAKAAPTVKFIEPLRQAPGFDDPGYWSISGYVDQTPGVGTSDFNNGTQTYDGHFGTDYSLFPYAWKKVQDNHVEVIAAADGVIEVKIDQQPDDHCDWNQPTGWNAVYVRHSDGTLAMYGHLKIGSLTTKAVGATVSAGEYLGVVASSGRSTGPHLHFEIRDADGTVLDPFQGPNNSSVAESMWVDQMEYLPSGINYLAISDDVTEPWSPNCPQVEETHEKSDYTQGETVYFTRMYRHQKTGHLTNARIVAPDNSVWQSWNQTFSNTYTESWWYNFFTLPANAQLGQWTFEVTYLGKVYSKNFNVQENSGSPEPCEETAADFYYNVSEEGDYLHFQFETLINSGFVSVHYSINGDAYQNYFMNDSGNGLFYWNAPINPGDHVAFYFIYQSNPQTQLPVRGYTVGVGCDDPVQCATINETEYETSLSELGNTLDFNFSSLINSGFVSVHYRVNGGSILNHFMNPLGNGNYDWSANGLNGGDLVEYYFIYESNPQTQTGWYSHTFGSCGSTPKTLAPSAIETITFYPNPATNELNLSREVSKVQVYDLLGATVVNVNKATTIDISSLSNGIYVLDLDGQRYSFVKN